MPISEEEAKKEIQDLFKAFLEPIEKEKEEPQPQPKYQIELTEEHLQLAQKRLIEDIEILKKALLKFQEDTASLSLVYYMESALNHYISKAIELEAMVKSLKRSHIFREKSNSELEADTNKLLSLLEDIYNNFIR